jgi:hypothetical protein
VSANDIALRSLSDAQLPALDLTATYGAAGVGGTQFVRQSGVLGSEVVATIPSGYSNALRILANQDAPTWNVALSLSYPIGTSPAEANWRAHGCSSGRRSRRTVSSSCRSPAKS